METIKETKYLRFETYGNLPGRKTKIIHIINKSSKEEIATIEWHSAWRQYCFMPERFEFDTVWNNTCLKDVLDVINMLMRERQIEKPERGMYPEEFIIWLTQKLRLNELIFLWDTNEYYMYDDKEFVLYGLYQYWIDNSEDKKD